MLGSVRPVLPVCYHSLELILNSPVALFEFLILLSETIYRLSRLPFYQALDLLGDGVALLLQAFALFVRRAVVEQFMENGFAGSIT